MRIQLSPSVIYTLTMAPCFQRHVDWTNRMIAKSISVLKHLRQRKKGGLELNRSFRIEAINFNLRLFPCLKVKSCTVLTGSC